ncbi:MAG TPA: Tim44/TimA family putative adaptor protein [Alphaproteobacteria bacterium]|nr:Tim44/TimA family putative adaptor protein [Alphaproteobacteria bacterium]
MGGGFQFFDIIFFALVAAFVILRLRSVLGRRTGHERPRPDPFRPVPPSQIERVPDAAQPAPAAPVPAAPAGSLSAGLAQIKIADPSFDDEEFIKGARAAFEYIVGAFSTGDEEKLKPLLSAEVFDRFREELRQRRASGHTHETTIVRLREVAPTGARIEGASAAITIRYVSEQINVTHDAAGQVVDGDPDRIAEVTDLWTYARNVRSSDPNWILVATDDDAPHP